MSGDLVVDGVGANQFADQFAARAGGAYAANVETVAEFGFNFLQGRGPPLQ